MNNGSNFNVRRNPREQAAEQLHGGAKPNPLVQPINFHPRTFFQPPTIHPTQIPPVQAPASTQTVPVAAHPIDRLETHQLPSHHLYHLYHPYHLLSRAWNKPHHQKCPPTPTTKPSSRPSKTKNPLCKATATPASNN